jgi:hypothetical protein
MRLRVGRDLGIFRLEISMENEERLINKYKIYLNRSKK